MKAFRYIYIGIITVLAIVGCGRGTAEKRLAHDEVVAINEQVLEKAISSPDSALMMIERLRNGDFTVIDTTGMSPIWREPLPDYRCDYLRAKVYAQTLEGAWLYSAIIIGERLMTTDAASDDPAYRQDVLEMLINACRQHHEDELTAHWSAQLIDLCRQNGDETEALRTEAEIGLVLSGIGHAEEGLAKIDSVLSLLSGKRQFNEMDASIIALKRKVYVLKNMERFGDIPATAQRMLDLMADYEQHPDEYHDGTYREPPEHLRPGYIDFYRAQAYMFMTEAYASLSEKSKVKSEKSAAVQQARKYLSLFEQTDYSKTFQARRDYAPTYGLLGEYEKMLAIHDEQEARLRQQGDTVCAEYATILRDRAMAAEAQGRYAEANRLHNAYETLTATLNDRLLQGKAHLYAARFHAAEQQREIERDRVRANRIAIVVTAAGIIAILSLLFALYAILQRRKTNRKNSVLAREIAEAIDYKEKYRELEKQLQSPPCSAEEKHPAEQEHPTEQEHLTEQEHPTEQEEQDNSAPAALFRHLSQIIRDEQLYLNPLFDRQAAVDRFGISTHQVGMAFSQGSPYKSLPAFIRELRLEHACRLLVTRPDMNIRDVGEASGFSNSSTFCSDFMKKYEITPSVYRQKRQQEQ